jgi:hypothetical protein
VINSISSYLIRTVGFRRHCQSLPDVRST